MHLSPSGSVFLGSGWILRVLVIALPVHSCAGELWGLLQWSGMVLTLLLLLLLLLLGGLLLALLVICEGDAIKSYH